MGNNRNHLIEILTLTLTGKKQVVESTYFFHQIYTRLGVFESINSVIQKLVNENYIVHEGHFGENSGLIKNITLTDQGKNYLEKTLTEKTVSEMEAEFDNFGFLKEVMDSELRSKQNS